LGIADGWLNGEQAVPNLRVDPGQIEQFILNLALYAREFTRQRLAERTCQVCGEDLASRS
jgi:hypothetical protein